MLADCRLLRRKDTLVGEELKMLKFYFSWKLHKIRPKEKLRQKYSRLAGYIYDLNKQSRVREVGRNDCYRNKRSSQTGSFLTKQCL